MFVVFDYLIVYSFIDYLVIVLFEFFEIGVIVVVI